MDYYKPVCACGCEIPIEVSTTAEVICPNCGEVVTNKTKPAKRKGKGAGNESAQA